MQDNDPAAPPPEDPEVTATRNLEKLIKLRAQDDAGYAIAWALTQLADATWASAHALDNLGLAEFSDEKTFGTTDMIAFQLGRVADALEGLGDSGEPEDPDQPPHRDS